MVEMHTKYNLTYAYICEASANIECCFDKHALKLQQKINVTLYSIKKLPKKVFIDVLDVLGMY